MIVQTNHQITKYAVENKWHGDLFTNGENLTAKTPPGDFQVTTPETPLLSQQAVTSKGSQYLIPTYSWTLTPIPNWTCSVMTISPFDAHLPSTWLTNCADPSTRLKSPTREGCWLQNSLVHPHDEDQEDAWLQNPTVHIHNNFFRRDELGQNFISGHSLLEQTILKACATCVLFDGP